MSDPYAAPSWQQWQTPVTAPWPAPQATDPPINWTFEAVVAGVVTAYSLVLGAIVGRIWPAVAPHVDLNRAVNGSEGATKALLGDDMWFALLALAGAVVAVAVLFLTHRSAASGPGASVGLAVGGLLGSLVAAHLGHHIESPHFAAILRKDYTPRGVSEILGYFDFKLRMKMMLVAWPLFAVLLHGAVVALRTQRMGRTTLAP